MRGQNLIRAFFFLVFFNTGAAALSVSVLYDEIIRYYHNQTILHDAQDSLDRLESLNTDYDALLDRLDDDPNLFRRVAPVTLGTDPQDQNAIYPRAELDQIIAARKALAEDTVADSAEPAVPARLLRCGEPRRRTALFVSGAALILISFACFLPKTHSAEQENDNPP